MNPAPPVIRMTSGVYLFPPSVMGCTIEQIFASAVDEVQRAVRKDNPLGKLEPAPMHTPLHHNRCLFN